MRERKDRPNESWSGEDAEAVAYYEALSAEEVDEHLGKAGINPQPTIDAVKALVREKLGRVRTPGS